jgi:hypothetical protein
MGCFADRSATSCAKHRQVSNLLCQAQAGLHLLHAIQDEELNRCVGGGSGVAPALLPAVLMLLRTKSREVVKSVLGFVKVDPFATLCALHQRCRSTSLFADWTCNEPSAACQTGYAAAGEYDFSGDKLEMVTDV